MHIINFQILTKRRKTSMNNQVKAKLNKFKVKNNFKTLLIHHKLRSKLCKNFLSVASIGFKNIYI